MVWFGGMSPDSISSSSAAAAAAPPKTETKAGRGQRRARVVSAGLEVLDEGAGARACFVSWIGFLFF